MNIVLPEHLKATADLLTRSLQLHEQDSAPAVPESLVSDLVRRPAGEDSANAVQNSQASLFSRIFSFVGTPGFGAAATAALIIGLFAPALIQPAHDSASNETFRGAHVTYTESQASIVLITDNSETRQLLEDSGLFDMSIVIETPDPLVAASLQTAKLLVDVKGGAIVGYNAESREVLADELPDDPSDIAERIALAFGALQ